MAAYQKELEIVYNLQWKTKGGSNGDDKANIVGIYDTPTTTLNLETFKSYLLKNCGATTEDDVKVSYISLDDREFPIDSQLDFQIALYSFRQRARNGNVIALKLERAPEAVKMNRSKRIRDKADRLVPKTFAAASQTITDDSSAPEWFKKYMKNFKNEVIEEITSSLSSTVSSLKSSGSSQGSCYYSRKSKVDCCKRPRKQQLLLGSAAEQINEKEAKLERKLDSKLEKLESKTMKLKKKMSLLRSSDSEGANPTGKNAFRLPLFDAATAGQQCSNAAVPHMSGGETYEQQWEVINTGEVGWTSKTEVRYAWGSQSLEPITEVVGCPKLQPGERGTVSAYIKIPNHPGHYESFWHFYQNGRRFGPWLGCQVIVDPSPVSIQTSSVAPESSTPTWSARKKLKMDDDEDAIYDPLINNGNTDDGHKGSDEKVISLTGAAEEDKVENVSAEMKELKIMEDDAAISSSDSDNQSIVSIFDSNSSVNSGCSDEFVLVAMPQSVFKDGDQGSGDTETGVEVLESGEQDNLEKGDSNNNPESAKANTSIKLEAEADDLKQSSDEDANLESEYAFITLDGKKWPVPKVLLRDDYLRTAEDAPPPEQYRDDRSMKVEVSSEENCDGEIDREEIIQNTASEVSGIASDPLVQSIYTSAETLPTTDTVPLEGTNCPSNSRLFVFPLSLPGFEVVYPEASSDDKVDLQTDSESQPSFTDTADNAKNDTEASETGGARGSAQSANYSPWWSHYHTSGGCNTCFQPQPASAPPAPESSFGYFPFHAHKAARTCNRPNYNTASTYAHFGHFTPGSNQNSGNTDGYRDRYKYNGFGRNAEHSSYMYPSRMSYGTTPCHRTVPVSRLASGERAHSAPRIFPSGRSFADRATPEFQGRGKDSGHSTSATAGSCPSPLPHIPAGMRREPSPGSFSGNEERPPIVQILPDTLVTGAVNVASSAINTARSVLNMFALPPRDDQPGAWMSSTPETPRQKAMRTLVEMGFWDIELNDSLLNRYNNDVGQVISELIQ